jgi:hypothetical protein
MARKIDIDDDKRRLPMKYEPKRDEIGRQTSDVKVKIGLNILSALYHTN